ncbi:glycosyltransferase family 4 protein [Patescibacteria group bacterium]|nr:glycosyltransferase family 4 protein [Patescibacteria group bacterium]MBU4579451.1 glycosyltransferase family 4 protein [Patescibacteria group bacterium]
MTIGIDLRAIGQGKYSGVEEYALNLLDALFAIDSKNKYLLFSSGQKISSRYLEFSQRAKEKNSNIDFCHCSFPNRVLNTSFKLFSWPKIDKIMGVADVVFEPNINLLPSSGAKKVVTFHDLSFEKYSVFFSSKQIFWHNFVNPEKLAKEADFIIAVSESTKNDLMEIYGIPAKNIKVIYSGVSQESRIKNQESRIIQDIKTKYGLPEKYILYLGTLEPRKNIIGLIKAYELFRSKFMIHNSCFIITKLVIAGSKGWLYEDIFHAAKKSPFKEDIIFTGFIADEDKPYLYNLASLFVYPSFYEGFGFPPLEAMASGVAVITSDCSSFPEVAGDSAMMVNPYNSGQLAWSMGEILSDKNLREKMIKKGLACAEKFSWEKCARETLELFEKVNRK